MSNSKISLFYYTTFDHVFLTIFIPYLLKETKTEWDL